MLALISSGTANANISLVDSMLVLFIGMVIVFLVLAILIIVVKIYCGVFSIGKNNGKSEDKPADAEQTKEIAPAPVAAVSTDTELVAAITAAITMMYAVENEDGEVPPFRVKSIYLK